MTDARHTGVGPVGAAFRPRSVGLVPDPALAPGIGVTPTAQTWGPWRVVLHSAAIVREAPPGAVAVATGNAGAVWDYQFGVNPAVEHVPLVTAGTRFWIGETVHTLTAPVWSPGCGNGAVGWCFSPPLPMGAGVGTVVWMLAERLVGACRVLADGDLTAERINATLIAFGSAINRVAGELVLTWEGAPQVGDDTLRVGAAHCAALFVRPPEGGDYLPVLVERAAGPLHPGLVRQASIVPDARWTASSTGTLWPVLAALQTALQQAGWIAESQ